MTADILGDRELEAFISTWQLETGESGAFEVFINDELVFSKKELGRHAEDGEVRALIEQKLEEARVVAGV
ncbi:MAG: Rdx family protein [Anaerolineaceae bacterium]|nr:Rdx family protein [Anaerolineaceae bacterium]MCY4010430.1 Rdx family protein [Anaerolineaceae bacterium]MCY4106920.1 Rdx family protein [Chloroflexota bacterium]